MICHRLLVYNIPYETYDYKHLFGKYKLVPPSKKLSAGRRGVELNLLPSFQKWGAWKDLGF